MGYPVSAFEPKSEHSNCNMFPVRLPCKSYSGISPGIKHLSVSLKLHPDQQPLNHV